MANYIKKYQYEIDVEGNPQLGKKQLNQYLEVGEGYWDNILFR